jgi:diadenosine tetraphosphate (Ap4A) HIT family hydrolase
MTARAERPCIFCAVPDDEIVVANARAYATEDSYPVSPGHTLVIPRRHVSSLFELDMDERFALLEILEQAKARLDDKHRPDGYNIGINDGAAAGQTIMHLHVHLMPRYRGDSADARGGVRWIFPEKAAYWRRK